MCRFRRSPLLALGLLAGASGLAFAAHEAAGVVATAQVRSALAHMPGFSATAVSADAWSGRVTIEGLSAPGVSVGKVRVVSADARLLPALIAPAFALDGTAMAENVVLDAGFIKYKFKKIEATGTAMSNDELAALLDVSSAAPMAERLQKFTAAAVTAPEIEAEMSMGDMQQSVTYRDFKMLNIAKGKVGSFSAGSMEQAAKMPDGETMHIHVGPMSGANIDIAGTVRFMTTARADDNEPLAMVQESMVIDGYSVDLEKSGVSFKIGKLTGRDLKMRPMKTPFKDFIALVSDKKAMENPDPEKIATNAAMVLDMVSCFEFGLLEARDIIVKLPPGGEVNSVKLGRFGVSGWANGKIGEYAFEGFELDAPDGHAKLGQFALRGFNFKHVLDAVSEHLAQGLDSFESADPRTFIPTLDQITVSGVDLDVPDKKGTGNSADGKRITMTLGKFEMNGSDYLGGMPTSLNAALDNFTFDIANSKDPQLKDFIAMGIKKFDMSAKIDLAWSEAAETLTLRQASGKMADIGAVTLKATLGNVSKDLFTGGKDEIEAALLGTLIKDADLRFENAGIVEKGLELEAKKQKKTADALKKEAVGVAGAAIPAMLKNAPAAKEIAAAVIKFINAPKSFHLGAKSADGLGIADLALLNDPAALLKKLAVVASAND
jgi:hypothetical protein